MVKIHKALFICLLVILPVSGVFSEGDLSLELGINNIFLETREINIIYDAGGNPVSSSAGEPYTGWMTAGSAGFSFKSTGDRNVKADLAFSFTDPGTSLAAVSLDRAWIKARFPGFRLTAGKTRLGWGDGFVFNSGDVIFGSTDISVDLTSSELRAETDWLTALNVPLGQFSFLEGVVLPPVPDFTGGIAAGDLSRTSLGGRFYTRLLNVKIEGGYFFNQNDTDADGNAISLHKPYLSFQGNLLADWYLSSSLSLPVGGALAEPAKDSLNISGGLFHMINLNSISSLTFRFELLYKPFHSWQEQPRVSGEDPPVYALLLYPEIGWTPLDTVNLSIRSIWSPVDASAMLTAGARWNVFEGFDLNLYAVFNSGDGDDTFSWDRNPDLWTTTDIIDSSAVIIGINYIY